MTSRRLTCSLASLIGVAWLAGCQQPAHDMSQGPPPRPAELDQLDAWVGTWKGTGEMTMYGPEGEQKMTTTGTESVKWICDNRVLMSEMEYEMGDMGAMKGLWLATWDPQAKKFRTWWFDNMGSVGEGTMWKDADTGEWIMRSKGRDAMTGESRMEKSRSKMTDSGTMEWSFTEYDGWGFSKKMSGTGTSKKM